MNIDKQEQQKKSRVNKHEYKYGNESGKPYRIMKPEEYKANHQKYYYIEGRDRAKCRSMLLRNIKLMKKPQRGSIRDHSLEENEVIEIRNELMNETEDIDKIKDISDHFDKIIDMIRKLNK